MANLGYFDLYNLYITYHNISKYYHDSLHLVPIDDKKKHKFIQDFLFFVPMAPWPHGRSKVQGVGANVHDLGWLLHTA